VTRPHRLRRALKWVGTAICGFLGAAYLLTNWWTLSRQTFHGGPSWGNAQTFYVGAGAVSCQVTAKRPMFGGVWEVHPRLRPFDWKPQYFHIAANGYLSVILPLWIPFAGAALPTALLLWTDKSRKAGLCPVCGYELTGNTTGVCPECGKGSK